MKNIPWMKFNPTDFMSDENVQLMCDEALGLYMRILCYSWKNESIPSDYDKIMKIFKLSKHKFKKLWPELCECFFEKDGRFFQKRLMATLQEAENYFQEKSDSGRKGAEKRWHSHGKANSTANGKSMQEEDREEEVDKDNKKSKPKKATPDIDECKAYFLENKSTEVEAEKFFYYYDSKGWKVGKAPMKKWRSAASGWIKRSEDKQKPKETDHQRKMREWAESED